MTGLLLVNWLISITSEASTSWIQGPYLLWHGWWRPAFLTIIRQQLTFPLPATSWRRSGDPVSGQPKQSLLLESLLTEERKIVIMPRKWRCMMQKCICIYVFFLKVQACIFCLYFTGSTHNLLISAALRTHFRLLYH